MLDHILRWAQEEETIQAVILQGSHASGIADIYSDYDLALYCSANPTFIQDDQWLSKIGKVWICVHEKLFGGPQPYPTRLVIFEGGDKADFAFYPLAALYEMVRAQKLSDEFNRGFKVLLDKTKVTSALPQPAHKDSPAKKPSSEEFNRVVTEFWFEVHHVAKYLKREDLWSVKFRSGLIHKHFLLRMIEWNEEARRHGETRMPPFGKRMASWVEKNTWEALQNVFGHFDAKDSWKALFATIELFRKLSKETAQSLGYPYPQEVDQAISGYVKSLKPSEAHPR